MKVVQLISGGLDSTTLLYYLRSKGYEIKALTFDYGQKHIREIEASKKICKLNNVELEIVDISAIKKLIEKGAITGKEEIPFSHYNEETQRVTVVPNRNSIMLAIAVGHAVTIGATKVFFAAHRNDRVVYPDCRKEFVHAFAVSQWLANLYENNKQSVWVEAPFVDMTKADIVKLGLELKVPFELTYSCYKGEERPCLKCGTCLERIEAFKLNNTKDPLLTDEEWEVGLKNLKEVS